MHLAARHNADVGMVETLIKAFPDAIGRRVSETFRSFNEENHLPLHIAAKFKADSSVIKLLLFPTDERTLLTLMLAVKHKAHAKVVELLFNRVKELSPENLLTRDCVVNHGCRCLPLHEAVSNDADLTVVEFLLKKFPDAANTTDRVLFCHYQHT